MTMTDPRASLTTAETWVADLLAGVRPEQFGLPTPCDEFDVARLIAHIHEVASRTLLFAQHQDIVGDVRVSRGFDSETPEGMADELRALTARSDEAWGVWTAEELGSQTVTGPFGTVPGAAAVAIMTSEYLVHGWDLAVATGQPAEADPEAAKAALAAMGRALPPAGARNDLPFADPVEPATDAGPTERLANFTGRRRP